MVNTLRNLVLRCFHDNRLMEDQTPEMRQPGSGLGMINHRRESRMGSRIPARDQTSSLRLPHRHMGRILLLHNLLTNASQQPVRLLT